MFTQFLKRISEVVKQPTLAKSRLIRVFVVVGVLSLVSSTGFYYFERGAWREESLSFQDAAWWCFATMTTVGYGDFYPRTWQGRWLIGLPTMLVGIGMLGYLITVLAAGLIERRTQLVRGLMPYKSDDHILICEYPGEDCLVRVVNEIRADRTWRPVPIVLLTNDIDELPAALHKLDVHFVCGNPARDDALRKANAARARCALIFISGAHDDAADHRTLAILARLRQAQPDIVVTVEVAIELNEALLRASGATEIVGAGRISSHLMVQGMQDPGLNDLVVDLLSSGGDHQIYIEAVDGFSGSFADLRDKVATSGALPIGLIRDGRSTLCPEPEARVERGHRVVFLGRRRHLGI